MNNEEMELYHHGIKGQKWGVRRFENKREKTIKAINSLYDHSNKWTNRKIAKLEAKGKTAKAKVMREMVKQNEAARKQKVSSISKMNQEQFKKQRRQDRLDYWFGGQTYKDRNAVGMTTLLTRLSEYQTQRGMRWMSNFTLNSTLNTMDAKKGYEYLNRKELYNEAFYDGYTYNS